MYKLLPSGTIYKHESYTKDYDLIDNRNIILIVINDLYVLYNRTLFIKSLRNIDDNDRYHQEIINEIKRSENAVA